MQTAEERFQFQLTSERHADVAAHLWLLRRYAAASRTCVELGVDDGSTSVAILLGRPEWLHSFDLTRQPEIDLVEGWAKELGVEFHMHAGEEGDSRTVTIPECQFCFIDTSHIAEELAVELERHAPRVKKYLLLHDVTACGEHSCVQGSPEWSGPGLWGPISAFLRAHDEWVLLWCTEAYPGLACLLRVR